MKKIGTYWPLLSLVGIAVLAASALSYSAFPRMA